jgi:hypothetical protein
VPTHVLCVMDRTKRRRYYISTTSIIVGNMCAIFGNAGIIVGNMSAIGVGDAGINVGNICAIVGNVVVIIVGNVGIIVGNVGIIVGKICTFLLNHHTTGDVWNNSVGRRVRWNTWPVKGH